MALLPEKIEKSYGISIPDQNLELLLQHRAVLFGIIGGFMIYAAISSKHYSLATLIGMISMVSFLVLYMLSSGEINPELGEVMKFDVIGILVLLIGYGLYYFSSR